MSAMNGVIGSITGVGSILSLVAKIGIGNIGKLVEQIKIVGNDSLDLKTRVLAAIEAADMVVDYTETQADDLIVQFLKDAAKQETLWKLVDIVGYLIEGKPVPSGALPEEGLKVGSDGSIPTPVAIELAKAIAMVITKVKEGSK
jgi:hypothetical protein